MHIVGQQENSFNYFSTYHGCLRLFISHL